MNKPNDFVIKVDSGEIKKFDSVDNLYKLIPLLI